MTLVVDASALVKLVLEEEHSEEFGKYFYTAALSEKIFSPDFALAEAFNAIWKHVKLLRDLGEPEGVKASRDLLEIWEKLNIYSFSRLSSQALEEALKTGLTVYDAAYLVLAEKLNAKLATFDGRLRKAAREAGVPIVP